LNSRSSPGTKTAARPPSSKSRPAPSLQAPRRHCRGALFLAARPAGSTDSQAAGHGWLSAAAGKPLYIQAPGTPSPSRGSTQAGKCGVSTLNKKTKIHPAEFAIEETKFFILRKIDPINVFCYQM